jgi:hypothetical protein
VKGLNKYFDWIRSQPCHFKDIVVDLPNYPRVCSVHWNMDKGIWINQASHIVRRNSWRIKGPNNEVFPNCHSHHQWWDSENVSPEIRESYLNIGKMYLSLYKERND